MPLSSRKIVCRPPHATDSMPALSSPKAPASMCSSNHVFLFGFETSPRTSGPIPNCPKLPVPQTKGRRLGRFFWGGTGSGLKYGFNCFGADDASRIGESFLDLFVAGCAESSVGADLELGLLLGTATGGSFSGL